MHCVAGDGVGIEVIVEYILGFCLGWMIFQSLFMRDMAGGSYRRAMTSTFVPELLSMNLLMAGMVPTVMALREHVVSANNPVSPHFWFVMSIGAARRFRHHLSDELVAGRQPSQARHDDGAPGGPSHGHDDQPATSNGPPEGHHMSMGAGQAPRPMVSVMALLSFLALAAGVAIAFLR